MAESFHAPERAFPYDTSAVSQDFATWAYIQESQLGQYVALVFLAIGIEDKWTDGNSEPYALVYGRDMEGATTKPMRFWRFEEGDVQQGSIYIARGLKVVADKYWNNEEYRYVPRTDGVKSVECCWRTALEEVTHVSDIAFWFP